MTKDERKALRELCEAATWRDDGQGWRRKGTT
jgi:hypothetical protein